jgi:hypothetical protein
MGIPVHELSFCQPQALLASGLDGDLGQIMRDSSFMTLMPY